MPLHTKISRKSLLYSKEGNWVKRAENPWFDVTMGSFDGTEICGIVGIYLLEKLPPLLGKENFRLYRDDGLATVSSSSGPVLYRMRKDITSILKTWGSFYYNRDKSHRKRLFWCYIQPINRKVFPIQKG